VTTDERARAIGLVVALCERKANLTRRRLAVRERGADGALTVEIGGSSIAIDATDLVELALALQATAFDPTGSDIDRGIDDRLTIRGWAT
jgi:hypothetical protein